MGHTVTVRGVDFRDWIRHLSPSAGIGRRARSRRRWPQATCSHRTLFERAPHVLAQGTLDLISKHVVPHAQVVASPTDDSRPGDGVEKATARSAPSRASDPAGDDAGKRPQESLKRPASPRANEQMKMCPHVGKVVDPDAETMGHRAKRVAHGALVPAKRPRPPSSLARENDVHGSPHADGAFELATPASDRPAMLGAHDLGVQVAREQRPLHEFTIVIAKRWAMLFGSYLYR